MSISNLLLLSYCFPPVASPESFVTAKIMGAMDGVNVDVVTANAANFLSPPDHSLDAYVEQHFGRVERVNVGKIFKSVLSLNRLPLRPDRFILLNREAHKVARRFLANGRYDALVTRSQYHSSHLVGLMVKSEQPFLPWIASFSDPWGENTHERQVPLLSTWSKGMAAKVVRQADHLVFPTQGIQNLFQGQHPDVDVVGKSTVIPHGFESSFYPDIEANIAGPLRLSFFGNFYGPRRVSPLFEALDRLYALGKITRNTLQFEFFTQSPMQVLSALELFPSLKTFVAVRSAVDHLVALEEMRKANVLVLVDAVESNPSIFLPSKLVDYIGADRPILALVPEGEAADYTRQASGWCANVGSIEDICNCIEDVLEAFRSQANDGEESVPRINPVFRLSLENHVLAHKMLEAIEKGIEHCHRAS